MVGPIADRDQPGGEYRLILRAKAGDRLALDGLIRMHSLRLAAHLKRRFPAALQSTMDVDDIVQETFLHVVRGIRGFESRGPDSFFAWLRAIGENRIVDSIREQTRKKRGGGTQRHTPYFNAARAQVSLEEVAAPCAPSQRLVSTEATSTIQAGIAQLAEDQRRALQLHCLEGQSLEQTADSIGRTPGAVRALIHRGKCHLLEYLRNSLG